MPSTTVRLSDKLLSRLESEVKGFESPSKVIERIMDFKEKWASYEMIKDSILPKLEYLKSKEISEASVSVLLHYEHLFIKEAFEEVKSTFSELEFDPPKLSGVNVQIKFRLK